MLVCYFDSGDMMYFEFYLMSIICLVPYRY